MTFVRGGLWRLLLPPVAVLCAYGCGPQELGSYGSMHTQADDGASVADAARPDDEGDATTGEVTPACDPACDDRDPCNGVETCVEGRCMAGSAPCSVADVAHCQPSCEDEGGIARCGITARDIDDDGFGDVACTQASPRGKDCDDANDSVYPEASEVCDGLDNDCDGARDLQDGLTLDQVTKVFGEGQLYGAAGSTDSTVGVVHTRASDVWFAALDAGGKRIQEPVLVSSGVDKGSAYAASVGFGHDAFGVAWSRNGELGFRRVSSQGALLGDEISAGPAGYSQFGGNRVARVGSGDWLLLFECCRSRPSLYGRRIDALGALVDPHVTIAQEAGADLSGVAVSGEQLGVVWWRIEQTPPATFFVEWSRRFPDLTPASEDHPVLTSVVSPGQAQEPVIAASPEGYAFTWSDSLADDTSQHLRIVEFDRQGNLLCGPIDLSTWYPEGALPVVPRAMVPTAHGYAIATDVWLSGNLYAIDVVEARTGCKYGQRFRVGGAKGPPNPTIASLGEAGHVVLWQDYVDGEPFIMQRSLAPMFCE